ncbi:MAG: acyltransferase family protein [Bryobacteraceae bacterium]
MATTVTTAAPAAGALPLTGTGRAYSIDAFRGFTMICMFATGFGLLNFIDHPVIGPVARQFTHRDWQGMNAWDLVQPFFMFIVGTVMPISFGRRWAAGENWGRSLAHVLRRCALLIGFGLFARSVQANEPVLDLINVLAQVAFTYLVAFLVLRKSWKIQGAVAFALLAAHWALFQFATAPGVQGPWVKDANIGWYLDGLVLGKHWRGSYATINCLSSASATIFGVMAGQLLVSALPVARKLRILAVTGVAGIALGLALDPFIPIIKKIWTASFAIYSTGFTLLALLLFYWVCDVKGKRAWAKVFVIVGANSIFIYVFHEVMHRWLERTALVFTSWSVDWWGAPGKLLTAWVVILFEIYICYWLYRRKIFFKL